MQTAANNDNFRMGEVNYVAECERQVIHRRCQKPIRLWTSFVQGRDDRARFPCGESLCSYFFRQDGIRIGRHDGAYGPVQCPT
ncbi:MAG: hypothetical protein RL088_2499 [Verrucomicrobiota bacterium]